MIIVALNEQALEGAPLIQLTYKAWANGASNHGYFKKRFLNDEQNVDMLAVDDETKSL